MGLSLRLQHIYDLIRIPCQVVVDIGYDHGKIMHHLLCERDCSVIGIEQTAHFATRYRQHYPDDRVDLRTGDGLQPIQASDPADVLILSGIGEENIRNILNANLPYIKRCQQIIFCCSSMDLQLRPFLNQLGWYAEKELILREKNKLYVVSSFIQGSESCSDAKQRAIGPRLFEQNLPLLDDYLDFVHKRFCGS